MSHIEEMKSREDRSPWYFILIFFIIILVGQIPAQLIATIFSLSFFNGDYEILQNVLQAPERNLNYAFGFTFLQGVASAMSFVLIPYLYLKFIEKRSIESLSITTHSTYLVYLLAFVITIAVMPITAALVEWNESIELPTFLSSFETSARAYEEQAKQFVLLMTHFQGIPHLILAIIVMGVVAGLGEELVFRGILQNLFTKAFKNPHIAIIVTGFLFSAIHFQFYGFFPRMLLGILFGYLYHWSKNLYVPMFAHFLNNTLTVIMVFLGQQGAIEYSVEETPHFNGLIIFLCIALCAWLMFSFRKQCLKNFG